MTFDEKEILVQIIVSAFETKYRHHKKIDVDDDQFYDDLKRMILRIIMRYD